MNVDLYRCKHMCVYKFIFLLLMLYFSFLSCKAFKCNIIQSVSVQCSFSSFTPNENNNKKEENKNKIKEIYTDYCLNVIAVCCC